VHSLPRIVITLSALTLLAAGCGSDAAVDAVQSNDTNAEAPATVDTSTAGSTTASPESSAPDSAAPTTDAPAPATGARVAPAGPADIAGAADVRTLLAQLHFPEHFPMPDGLTGADVAGLELTQSASSELQYTSTTSVLAWREPAPDDPAALAQEWFDRGQEALGVADASSTGKITGNDLEGFLVSGGLPDESNGELSVTVIRHAGDTTVVVEIEHEIEVSGAVPDLQFAPELLTALPDISGCVAELIEASFKTYNSPNSFTEDPAYATIFDGNCPTSASMDSMRTWAATSGGQLNDNEQNLNVYGATGPDGMSIETSAYLGDDGTVAIRIDTTTPIT